MSFKPASGAGHRLTFGTEYDPSRPSVAWPAALPPWSAPVVVHLPKPLDLGPTKTIIGMSIWQDQSASNP